MNKYLWPWESEVLIQYPWVFSVFVVILGVLLSTISWKRQKE